MIRGKRLCWENGLPFRAFSISKHLFQVRANRHVAANRPRWWLAQRRRIKPAAICSKHWPQRRITSAPGGSAAKMKLATNLVLGLNRAVLAEGLVFARAAGLAMEDALTVLLNSPAYSRTMDAKGPKMVQGEFTRKHGWRNLKDARLMLETAHDGGVSLPFTSLHVELLGLAVATGLGDLDNSR